MMLLAACLQGCAPRHQITVHGDTVILVLHAPQAQQVQFACSEDRYNVREALRKPEGTWLVTGLPNREFQYFYLVDGKMFIPDCRFQQLDDFGTSNCRYLPWPGTPEQTGGTARP